MSELIAITARIAEMPLTHENAPVNVWNDDGSNAPVSAELPLRIILPVGYPPFTAGFEIPIKKMGGVGNPFINWTIGDLYLLMPKTAGTGTAAAWAALRDYVAQYARALSEIRRPTEYSEVENWTVEYGNFAFPEGSNNWYYGILNTLTVKERIC